MDNTQRISYDQSFSKFNKVIVQKISVKKKSYNQAVQTFQPFQTSIDQIINSQIKIIEELSEKFPDEPFNTKQTPKQIMNSYQNQFNTKQQTSICEPTFNQKFVPKQYNSVYNKTYTTTLEDFIRAKQISDILVPSESNYQRIIKTWRKINKK
ncbi:hypothetical protein SS50377_23168 [Spironucleus salmonicida]|uniref:Uncharacterized protein n=1 Tax=Spironucleus salmonicida TaxID=348837 RepID=V6LDB1_9EUKA|nr:hypothetical protein SS50377_23168 [Spironucleus salmonicida]|eukprot:EST41656.1 Hypothetical protein SS50377_18743 [Spironucleus salmonicida]